MSTSSVRVGGTLAAAGDAVTVDVGGLGACALQIAGTWAGTLVFEVSLTKDDWVSLNSTPPNSTTAVTGTSANGLWTASIAGMASVRVRCSAFTSGSIQVSLQAVAAGGSGGGGGGGAAGDVNLATVGGVAIALGQAAMAASVPVVLASNQTAIPVTVTGGGDATAANQVIEQTLIGAVNETAPATDTANSGLNGRLQRIAQRITSLITALGSPFQAGGSIGNTTFAATQGTATNLKAEVIGAGTAGTANAGVVTVQGIASMTPVQVSQATASNFNAQVVGNIAHDSVDSGNPIKVGNKALAYGTNPTGVANNDRTDAYANIAGIPFTLAGHPNVLTLLANFTSAQTNTALITVSGGTKIVLLSCTVAADHANTVDVQVRIGFATATTPTTTSVYLSHPGIAAGSGIREAGMVAGADGEDLRITCEVPTSGSLDVVMKYFTIEE